MSPSITEAQDKAQAILRKRAQYVGPNVALNYATPLHIVRGEGCFLYDGAGRRYLDCVNNVAHVGHCHPEVVAATCGQLQTLNTNCRYLHDNYTDYCEALTATMPQPLEVAYMVCSGSEANDLALRIARAATGGATHVAVIDGAYHGHVGSLIDISPYKFNNPGGAGRPSHVHVLPTPDVYRGTGLDGRAAARAAIQAAKEAGGRLSAFIAESVMSCAGQVIFPDGWLRAVYDEMHAAGVVCIADEVQVGFGRVGRCFWGFELSGVVPDIVTVGKPMGNGFPMGALITSHRLADAFNNGMEYFATYGGCTAAGATGLAVLHVLRQECMQERAVDTGAYVLDKLRMLQQMHPDVLGDVRGVGLMAGFEWVTDPVTKTPAPAIAKWVKEGARVRGVLLSTDGMCENINKIKPPMCFGKEEVDAMIDVLTQVLTVMTPEVKQQLINESHAYMTARRALWARLDAAAAVRAEGRGKHPSMAAGSRPVVGLQHLTRATISHGSMAASDTDVSEDGDEPLPSAMAALHT